MGTENLTYEFISFSNDINKKTKLGGRFLWVRSFMDKFAYLIVSSYYLIAPANVFFISSKADLVNLLYQRK